MGGLHTLSIDTEADPGITLRICALVAANNTIPAAMSAVDLMNGQMQIVLSLRNLDDDRVAYLAARIENMATVNRVRLSRIWRRDRDAVPSGLAVA